MDTSKVRLAVRMAREALGRLGEELLVRSKILGISVQLGPFSVSVEPKKPKCSECGQEKS